MLSYLSADSTTTDKRIPKVNLSFEFFKSVYVFIFTSNRIPNKVSLNPSRLDPERREKINLKFLFSHFFVVLQKVFL